jgi:uncharacterized repeat protein (TIGR02543 family)
MAAVYDVTYYKNDGSGTSLNCGDPVPAPLDQITSVGYNWDTSPTPQGYDWSRDGYTFVEWNTSADGTGTSYAPGATNYPRTLSIYAIWQENVNDITVTYNGDTIFSTSASCTQIFETENSFMTDDLVLTYNRYAPQAMVLPSSTSSTSSGSLIATILKSSSTRYLNIPVGYNGTAQYYTIDAVPNGTAGTPTATKGTVSNHSVSVTPQVTNVTGYIAGGAKTGTAVTVTASELVSGTKTITVSGTTDVTNYANASVAAGTAGTPVATLGTVSNNSVSVTPSVTNTTGYITGSTKTGTAVTVSASDLVSGTKSITSSGTTDVTNYASASVAAGSATPPSTISGSSATVSTGTNTLTLSKTISITPTVSAGYIASGTAGNSSVSLTASVTTKGATTYTPTTTDQTIASGTYLTGVQTVKGDSNLVAANIASGITIFNIVGTHSGGTDVSDTTATASDVLSGKYFYNSAGVKTQGTITIYAGEHHLAIE